MSVTVNKEAFLIYDNTSPTFTYRDDIDGGLEWGSRILDAHTSHTFNNTVSFPLYGRDGGAGGSHPSSVMFAFQGTSVALYGRKGVFDSSSGISWRLDGNTTSTRIPEVQESIDFGEWFSSPHLNDGFHRLDLDFTGRPNISIDFAVVGGGFAEEYNNPWITIIVDDHTPSEIYYFGRWNQDTAFGGEGSVRDNEFQHRLSFRNGSHRTSSIGSGFRFRFLGSSLKLFGSSNRANSGSFNVTYTIDNQEPRTTHYSTSTDSPPSPSSSSIEQPNLLLADFSSLSAGEHTLTANLTSSENEQEFIFDYLVYKPSFANLASKPTYDVASLDPSTDVTRAEATNTPDAPMSDNRGTDRRISSGAIAGTVIGALSALGLLACVAFWICRRRKLNKARSHSNLERPNSQIDPFDILSDYLPPGRGNQSDTLKVNGINTIRVYSPEKRRTLWDSLRLQINGINAIRTYSTKPGYPDHPLPPAVPAENDIVQANGVNTIRVFSTEQPERTTTLWDSVRLKINGINAIRTYSSKPGCPDPLPPTAPAENDTVQANGVNTIRVFSTEQPERTTTVENDTVQANGVNTIRVFSTEQPERSTTVESDTIQANGVNTIRVFSTEQPDRTTLWDSVILKIKGINAIRTYSSKPPGCPDALPTTVPATENDTLQANGVNTIRVYSAEQKRTPWNSLRLKINGINAIRTYSAGMPGCPLSPTMSSPLPIYSPSN
ncbi:hypothetical protein FA15DRAFT_691352 [Coprinopsis marcescibilis]|uniref:Uncharacterized protein n=1 Tax=Coprinopsis marcescibilis TaxID=230819 RepID=A0A5C3L8P9_COPMA|nr:hypothetical protein FA15DRAFT_691352 [Coprinopsis marcescibilis]